MTDPNAWRAALRERFSDTDDTHRDPAAPDPEPGGPGVIERAMVSLRTFLEARDLSGKARAAGEWLVQLPGKARPAGEWLARLFGKAWAAVLAVIAAIRTRLFDAKALFVVEKQPMRAHWDALASGNEIHLPAPPATTPPVQEELMLIRPWEDELTADPVAAATHYPAMDEPIAAPAPRPRRFRIIWSDPTSQGSWLGRVTAPIWEASDRLEMRLRTLRWPEDRRTRGLAAAAGLLIGASAVALAAAPGGSAGTTVALAASDPDKATLEQTIRDYILNHPEIIPEAMDRLRARETAKTIADNRPAIETPFSGAWAGAKDGDVTLVEFSDYACGYCRASVGDVDRLLAEDKKLKVVWREIPILGEGSEQAARLSLSAARQGRFLDFHRRMYAAGKPDAGTFAKVQKALGLDQKKLAADIADPAIQKEIDRNVELARTLAISGTPTFVIGDKLLSGAVGYAALKQAVEDARAKKG
jgi:protein-disulfide isomerase